MRNEEKLNLVEAGDVLDTRSHARNAATSPITPLNARAPYDTHRRERAWSPPAPAAPSMHYALLLALTWLCGPAALLLTPAGRSRRGWLGLGLAATAAAGLLVAVSYARFTAWTGLATPLAWGTLALLATFGGFSAWSRAVLLAGAHLPPPQRLPRLLRSAPGICALGLLAPGSGLLLTGRRWHASLWLWALWPAALGAIVLRSGLDMWRHLSATLPDRAAADLLESALIVAAVAVALGALAWIVQGLEGARRLVSASVPAGGRGRANWFAVALGVTCAVHAVGTDRQQAARQLGDAAQILQAEGLGLIPLQLSLAADRLDPARSEYAVAAIALHEQRGNVAQAAALCGRLDEGLASYVALRERPTGGAGQKPAATATDPARSGEEDLHYGTMARPRRSAAGR